MQAFKVYKEGEGFTGAVVYATTRTAAYALLRARLGGDLYSQKDYKLYK